MAKDEMNGDWLDKRIILALEAAPNADIPADFAARVARQLTPREIVSLTPGRYGQRTALAGLAVLLLLMLAFANRATGSSPYWFSLESIFCVQFVLLAVWLVARGYDSAGSF